MTKFRSLSIVLALWVILSLMVSSAGAQEPTGAAAVAGSAFTYQGQLRGAGGDPVTAACDFNFILWDSLTGGSQVGTTVSKTGVAVNNGLFTVKLDFGAAAFTGSARWLETLVECSGDTDFVDLSPRQELTPAPYALYASAAGNANTVTNGVYTTGSYNNPSWITHVAGSKISGAVASATNADTVDGIHAAAFQQNYSHQIVVAKSGGDFTTITAALNSITDNSAGNPYLIYVAPGVYTEQVTMKSYVDIEGAGEAATRITFTGSSDFTGTVISADHTELRFLTVENTGGNYYAIAVSSDACSGSERLTHVTLFATGASDSNFGAKSSGSCQLILTDITSNAAGTASMTSAGLLLQGSATLENVTSSASSSTMNSTNWGIYMGGNGSSTNVTATGSGGATTVGIYISDGSVTMSNVNATAMGGTDANVGIGFSEYHGRISSTMMDVIATASGGLNAYGISNQGATSLTMTSIIATASGATNTYGVYNNNSSPKMVSVTASASATTSTGTTAWGVRNNYNCSPIMTNVIASASGGATNYGVENYYSNPIMTNVTATATATGTNFTAGLLNNHSSPIILNSFISGTGGYPNNGIQNKATSGTYTVKINNSRILGNTSIIYSDVSGAVTSYTTYIGASQLDGGGAMYGAGTYSYVCTGAYDGNYTAFNSACTH
jgi:hypothetical protein